MRLRPALIADTALMAGMTGVSQFMFAHWDPPGSPWVAPDARGAALLALAHLPLAARRLFPVAVLAIACASAVAYYALDYYHSVMTFALALAVFSVASYRPPRVSIVGAAVAVSVLVFGTRLVEPGFEVAAGAIVVFFTGIAWGFGESMRQVGERGRRLAVLTERLRREQGDRARHAVAQEQRRIARELHDVVAHHMSVISVQAGLGRYVFDADPAMAKAALGTVESTAHEALGDMRRLLAVLRVPNEEAEGDEETPYDTAPGIDRLPELLARMGIAGARVELAQTGERVPLAPGLDLSVYRVVQESLTNVLKHADPPIATVELGWKPERLTVRVLDSGHAPGGPQEPTGHGLIGMRERARIYGGTLSAGPRPEGGFAVVLSLPLGDRDDDRD